MSSMAWHEDELEPSVDLYVCLNQEINQKDVFKSQQSKMEKYLSYLC